MQFEKPWVEFLRELAVFFGSHPCLQMVTHVWRHCIHFHPQHKQINTTRAKISKEIEDQKLTKVKRQGHQTVSSLAGSTFFTKELQLFPTSPAWEQHLFLADIWVPLCVTFVHNFVSPAQSQPRSAQSTKCSRELFPLSWYCLLPSLSGAVLCQSDIIYILKTYPYSVLLQQYSEQP